MRSAALLITIALAAPALAALTGEPRLEHPLRLFAFDIPLFTLAIAHRMLLVGRGAFVARAVLPVVRWVARLVLVTILVSFGWSLDGVIVGCLAASALELAAALARVEAPVRPLFVTCNALMQSRLGEPDWLLEYWTRSRLFSVEARRSWMEPDIKELPF